MWMILLFLVWLLPQVFIAMAMALESLGLYHGKQVFVLTPEADGKPINLWKPRKTKTQHREENGKDWQIQRSTATMVHKEHRSNSNPRKAGGAPIQAKPGSGHDSWALQKEAQPFQLFLSEHHYVCDFQHCSWSCFPFCCRFHRQEFWAWVPRRGDGNCYLGLEGGRKEKVVVKYHCPQKHTCELPPTVTMAPPQPCRVFFCIGFDHYQQYYLWNGVITNGFACNLINTAKQLAFFFPPRRNQGWKVYFRKI